MNSELEIESKVLLDSEDFYKIIKYLNLENFSPVIQTNYYIDTSNMELMRRKINLRVREIKSEGSYTMTVKIPKEEGNLELNQEISYRDFIDLWEFNKVPNGLIKNLLDSFHHDELKVLTSLTTRRIEISYHNGKLALDYNTYSDSYDYELEFEGKSMFDCERVVSELLESLGIDFKFNNISKRKRALSKIKK